MKTILRWNLIVALSLFALSVQGAGLEPRKDINPALIYWKAFGLMPRLSEEDQKIFDYYQTTELNEDYHRIAGSFNGVFKLIHQATEMEVPVDWGYDPFEGPEMMLPELSKAKYLSNAAALKLRSHLAQGDEALAVQEVLDTFAFSRNIGQEPYLICPLVAYAMDHILIREIAQNFYLFSDESLQDILDGIHDLSQITTISQSFDNEKVVMGQWVEERILEIIENPSSDFSSAEEQFVSFFNKYVSLEDSEDLPDLTIREYHSTITETYPLFDEAAYIARLPYKQYVPKMEAFYEKVDASENFFVRSFFPALKRARNKEFESALHHAFLKTAIEYRIQGSQALENNSDPFGNGPFRFERFILDSEDRGFKLTSEYDDEEFNSFIFIETPGPAVVLWGPRAGTIIQGE